MTGPTIDATMSYERRATRQIHVGTVPVGGGAPVTVQSMTTTKTANVDATLAQVYALSGAGADIVRIDRAPPILEETERAEITDLGVRPAMRLRGVGRRLVEAAHSWVRDRGVERIEIQVATGNREGQAFWRAIGYSDLMDVLHKRL